MKIIIAGRGRSKIHEKSLANAFKSIGCDVNLFLWGKYLDPEEKSKNFFKNFFLRIENKLEIGFTTTKINNDLIKFLDRDTNLLFIYRGRLISSNTIKKLKNKYPSLVIASYNNDSFISKHYNKFYWARFKKAIKFYDIIFSYRPNEIEHYNYFGANYVKLLPPWFVKEINHPVSLSKSEKKIYNTDIVFSGHYENDGREKIIEKLVLDGFKFNLFGPGWNKIVNNNSILKFLYPVKQLKPDDYNKSICGAKIAICMYSNLNMDVYTRRCFEIPATRTLMIAKRTEAIKSFFKEDHEAVYYDTYKEMKQKLKFYLQNNRERKKIAENGYKRATKDKYDVIGRAEKIIEHYNNYLASNFN